MSQFTKIDKMILGIATVLVAILSFLLFDDSLFFPNENTNKLEILGSITQMNNDVRRKNNESFIWIPTAKKSNIFHKDSIFTGTNSSAIINLNDGTRLDIKENSLITLNFNNGQMNLNLRYGDLVGTISANSKIKLQTEDQEFDVQTEKETDKPIQAPVIRLRKSRNIKALQVQLQSGKANLIEVKTEISKPLDETPLVITKTDPPKKLEPTKITLQTKNNFDFLMIKETDSIQLNWTTSGPKPRIFQIEISKNSNMTDTLIKEKVEAETYIPKEALSEDHYYWAVTALGEDGILDTSGVQEFSVTSLTAPQILTPNSEQDYNKEIPFDSTVSNEKINLSFKSKKESLQIQWQISSDIEFKQLNQDIKMKEQQTESQELPAGSYYLRARNTDENGNKSLWSPTIPFKISFTRKPEEIPIPPKLVQNNIKFRMPNQINTRQPSSIPNPIMSWTAVPRGMTYNLQVSTEKNFDKNLSVNTQTLSAPLKEFRPGKFYFRVQAKTQSGLLGTWSQVGEIDVAPAEIKIKKIEPILAKLPSATDQPPQQDFPIHLSPVTFAEKYQVEMATDPNFKEVQKFEFSGPSGKITIGTPGTYQVRARALDSNGIALSDYTISEPLTYLVSHPLPTPNLLEPFDKTTVFLQKDIEPFIWLEWGEVANAEGFKLEISMNPEFKETIISADTKENRFLINQKIPHGKIYWRVKALSKEPEKISLWSKQREFKLMHQEKDEGFVK